MTRQLAFDLPHREARGRGDFFVSKSNRAALAAIEGWRDWPGGKLLLTGPEGAGKSHLVQVWADLAGAEVLAADGLAATDPAAFAGRRVALEDADRRAGDPAFEEALLQVARVLAWKMIRDGEGADKVIKVEVNGATTAKDAELAARSVANSLLVKTSWHGTNPKWGRVMDALGYSPARIDESKVSIAYDGVFAVRNGIKTKASPDRLKKIHAQERFTITIDLGLGKGASYVFGCDCAHKYIDINI